MTADDKKTTPLKAAKLAYVMCAEQLLQDNDLAKEMAMLDKCTPTEMAAFREQLHRTARRVRRTLRV
jgi:hypothetical protein